MGKRKLFLDFDSTIVDSIKAYCDTYNELYQFIPGFKKANWYEVEKWDMRDQCPLVLNCNDIFSSELFFQKCDFINENTKEVVERLCEKYHVIVCSIGTAENIAFKSLWLKENLDCIKEYVFLVNDECKIDKSSIDMSGAIFMDDVESNLNSSNAEYKICFGDIYEWNKDWSGIRTVNWTDVDGVLL